MTDPGTLTQTDDGPQLRFERLLRHRPERVWRAITDPEELAVWFPAFVEYEGRVGAPIRFTFPEEDLESMGDGPTPEMTKGEVREFDRPHRFSFTWDRDLLTFELTDEDGGCRLVFTHLLVDSAEAPSGTASGWHVCLDTLSGLLDGALGERPPRQQVLDRVEEVAPAYEHLP